MSYESNIPASSHLFTGEDKILSYEIFAADGVAMENVATFSLRWELRRWGPSGTSVITKTTGNGGGITITGTYNSNRSSNTQRVLVAIADTDTEDLPQARYTCALKRMDAGLEAVLSHGTVELLVAAVRA